jgi:hypothetical protein
MPMESPHHIDVGPWTVRLRAYPHGPIAADDDPTLAALAWLVSTAADPASPLARAVETGAPFLDQAVMILRLRDRSGQDGDAVAAYQARSGGPPPPDALIVGVDWHPRATVVGAADLRAGVHALRDLRKHNPMPPSELFTETGVPSPPVDLAGLEQRATALQRWAAALSDRPEPAALLADRDQLLTDLGRAGLLSEAGADAKRYWLQTWDFAVLLSLHEAALHRLAYAMSSDRAKFIPVSEPVAVSLDLFRTPPEAPAGHTTFSWIGFGERMLRYAPVSQDGEGSVFVPDPAGIVVMRWRRERGHRCLVALVLDGGPR